MLAQSWSGHTSQLTHSLVAAAVTASAVTRICTQTHLMVGVALQVSGCPVPDVSLWSWSWQSPLLQKVCYWSVHSWSVAGLEEMAWSEPRRFRFDTGKTFFIQMVAGWWNPREMVTAPSLTEVRNIWTKHSGARCDFWGSLLWRTRRCIWWCWFVTSSSKYSMILTFSAFTTVYWWLEVQVRCWVSIYVFSFCAARWVCVF